MHDASRFERKFVVPCTAAELVQVLRTHPAVFREHHPTRFVNNVYYDTLSFQSYFDTVDGVANRAKVRVRWYGEHAAPLIQPTLEVKYKYGFLTKKVTHTLQSCSFTALLDDIFLRSHSMISGVPVSFRNMIQTLFPVLVNRYLRRYFVSADRTFRITIDDQLSSAHISSSKMTTPLSLPAEGFVIAELKYAPSHDARAEAIIQYFPFRLSKFSKYAYSFERCFQ